MAEDTPPLDVVAIRKEVAGFLAPKTRSAALMCCASLSLDVFKISRDETESSTRRLHSLTVSKA